MIDGDIDTFFSTEVIGQENVEFDWIYVNLDNDDRYGVTGVKITWLDDISDISLAGSAKLEVCLTCVRMPIY